MQFVPILFSLLLLIPEECSSAALRRGMAVLSVAPGGKFVCKPYASLLVREASFAAQQKQRSQQSTSKRSPYQKIENAPVASAAMGIANKELTEAIRGKNWAAAERIMVGGIKAQGLDKDYRTPLTLAIIHEAPFELIKKILLSGGVSSIRQKDKHGFDAYVYALTYGPGKQTLANILYAAETAQWPRDEKNTIRGDETVLQMILDAAGLSEE
ncbi:hypothetical protein FJ365_03580 [Candidatus Dependentiae bacterium]|nr:hypothetical protein [Candidatus Dependentiae bacterium]